MTLSRRVARFNKLINNPIQGTYAWLLPPWSIIVHRGRRSGREYRTPVLAFRRDGTLVIALLYGERSDWLRNLRVAGGGYVVRGGHTFAVGEPRVIDTGDASQLGLSPVTRAYCRLAEKQALLDIGEWQVGFGPRPHLPVRSDVPGRADHDPARAR
jgi:deazaflavin-dependent oxidoreductase (nitroreductase family)